VCVRARAQQARQAPFAAGLGEIGEQASGALLEYGETLATSLVAEGTRRQLLPTPMGPMIIKRW
jgi:hypothetical protein